MNLNHLVQNKIASLGSLSAVNIIASLSNLPQKILTLTS